MHTFLRKFLAVCAALAFNCHAGELITSREFFVDDSSNKTLEAVHKEQFTSYSGVLSKGYTKAAIWLRLEITPPPGTQPNDDIIVRIRPFFLDEIRLFDTLDESGSTRVVGDTAPMKSAEFPSLSHTFVIPAGNEPRKILLRLKTSSTSLISVEALNRKEMYQSELKLNLMYFTELAILAMFLLFILINWTNHRETLYALFVVRQIFNFAYAVALFGLHKYIFKSFPEISIDHLFSWIVIVATATSFIFEWKLLSEYSPNKWGRIATTSLLAWSGAAILLMILGEIPDALKLNMILSAVGIIVLMLVALSLPDPKNTDQHRDVPLLSKNLIVGYYASLNMVLILGVLPLLGVLQGTELALNGLVLYAMCSSLIMTGLMQARINKQRKIHSEYANKLLLSEHRIIMEKTKREEQTHLFHMLMHEIKNPLAVIDMALLANNDKRTTSAYVSRAVNSVKDILDRCFKANRLSDGNIDVTLTTIFISDFINQLLQNKLWECSSFDVNVNESFSVKADHQLLGVALNNLLDNAVRYGDPQSPIHIEALLKTKKVGDSGIAIVVSNRPGIASWPDPDKVFRKYYRSAGAETQPGTGLGLYLVRTLANLMQGECSYVPDDKNIRFELWLPT